MGYEISFENIVKGINVEKIMVRAKLDNNRILKQSGAFYIFGNELENEYSEYLKELKDYEDYEDKGLDGKDTREKLIVKNFDKISKNEVKTTSYEEEKGIIISKESKKEIRDFLSLIGINESTLFPELEYQAKHIKEKYQYIKSNDDIVEDEEIKKVLEEKYLKPKETKIKKEIKVIGNIIEKPKEDKKVLNLIKEVEKVVNKTGINQDLYRILDQNLVVDWQNRTSTLSGLRKDLKRLFKNEEIDNKYVEEVINILIEKY